MIKYFPLSENILQMKLEDGLVGIGKMSAGNNYNIVANEAVLEGTGFDKSVEAYDWGDQ